MTIKSDNVNAKQDTSTYPTVLVDYILQLNRFVSFLLYIYVILYSLHTQPDLKQFYFFLLCGRTIDLILLPLITLSRGGGGGGGGGGIFATSVEYNVQTRAILGIVSYAVALWFITQPMNPLRIYMNDRTKEFVALAITCGYKSVDLIYDANYCIPFHGKSIIDTIEDNLTTPLSLLLMVHFQYGDIERTYSTILGVFVLYKMLRLASEYQIAADATTVTKPQTTLFNITLAKSVQSSNNNDTIIISSTKEQILEDPKKYTRTCWRIYGNVYDMTEYIAYHPGGKEAIMLGANRDDCTALFQSYHAFTIQKAKAVLEKYRISSDLVDQVPPAGTNTPVVISSKHENDPFYDELVRRVSIALKNANIDPVQDRAGTLQRWAAYCIFLMCFSIGCFFHCRGYLLGSLLFAIGGSWVAGHIGHDGGHFTVSRFPLVNDVAVWGMCIIGNPIIWQHQHTYAHHSYTNVGEHDPDLHHWHAGMRTRKCDPYLPQHKHQSNALYTLSNFVMTTFFLCYPFAVRFVLERSLHGAVEWSDRTRFVRTIGLLFHIVAYSTVIIIIPYFVHDSWWKAAIAGWIVMGTSGIYFALISQVGHITENALGRDCIIAKTKRHEIAKNSWAAEQIETTNDFCPQSTMGFFLGCGLGYQIEHHLFPSLNHCHLYIIQPIVEKTAKEFNVQYTSYKTFTDAIYAYLGYIKSLSKEENITN